MRTLPKSNAKWGSINALACSDIGLPSSLLLFNRSSRMGAPIACRVQVTTTRQAIGAPILEDRLNNSRDEGSPMSEQARAFMEPHFAFDLGKVRIHADGNAVRMNLQFSAH